MPNNLYACIKDHVINVFKTQFLIVDMGARNIGISYRNYDGKRGLICGVAFFDGFVMVVDYGLGKPIKHKDITIDYTNPECIEMLVDHLRNIIGVYGYGR